MSLMKPTFADLIRHYPGPGRTFGVTHACAIRMSIALMNAVPDFFAGYTGTRQPSTGAVTNSLLLANYLEGPHVGWFARTLGRGAAAHRAALGLSSQGIIFWDVLPDAAQIAYRTSAEATRRAQALREGRPYVSRPIRASPNHIDLWDPARRALRERGGRTMTWFPEAGIVESARFWDIPVRSSIRLNPFNLPRGMELT